jgi:hypothetical protein
VDTFSVIPYVQVDQEILVGLETRSLPTFETRSMGDSVAVIPAWRISVEAASTLAAREELEKKMKKDFSLEVKNLAPLGEGYFPSSGQTPEKVHPYAAEVDLSSPPKDLIFIPLKTLLLQIENIPDLHTRLGVYRLAHATGILNPPTN